MIDVRQSSRQKDGTQNIKIIRRIKPYQIESIERANRDGSNDAICMRIGLMVIE
jgi:hypothetical protein